MGAAAFSYMDISVGWGLIVGGILGYEYPPLEVVARGTARVIQIVGGSINGLLLGCNEAAFRIIKAFSKSPAAIIDQFRPLAPGWLKFGGQAAPRKPS